MISAQEIIDKVHSYHPEADGDLILRAYELAKQAHTGQRRKTGDPYFIHPASVAWNIADMRLDTASVCVGLLHDVVEDTDYTVEEIAAAFGQEIAELVDGVTKLTKMNFTSKEDRQAESFRKMVIAMARDLRVILVKLCDRLDNMRSLDAMSDDSRERIDTETMEIYAPLANRLGMHDIRSQLEDLSLLYLEPSTYGEIRERLEATQAERDHYIDGVSRTISTLMGQLGFSSDVSGRAKHITSVYRKMREHECDFSQVYDLLAFRVCMESVSDCYAALGVIHSKWTPVPGRFKDYIALPKPNRYQSLHTTVIGPGRQRIEIQIRTHEMHRIADLGVAAHWQYKERNSGGMKPEDAAKFSWLRDLAEFQHSLKDPAEFLESVKVDLFPDEVYVFTPKGDVRVFPRGATPIDFAYDIHSEVGDHCSGARANGKIVPIRHRLRNGDVVDVITSNSATPNKDWLEYCVTSKARHAIRAYLRHEHRGRSLNLGRELLEGEMNRTGLSHAKLLKNGDLTQKFLHQLHLGTMDEVYLAIGFGKVPTHKAVQAMRAGTGQPGEAPSSLKRGPIESIVNKVRGKDTTGIEVNGIDDVLVRFAKCCNPVPGDSIIGFVTRGRGCTVHRRDCARAYDTDPERRLEVSWAPNSKVNRRVSVKVTTYHGPGILAEVSGAFSSHKISIAEAMCRTNEDGTASNVFTFTVQDLPQLKGIIRSLKGIKGVVGVDRV